MSITIGVDCRYMQMNAARIDRVTFDTECVLTLMQTVFSFPSWRCGFATTRSDHPSRQDFFLACCPWTPIRAGCSTIPLSANTAPGATRSSSTAGIHYSGEDRRKSTELVALPRDRSRRSRIAAIPNALNKSGAGRWG